MPVRGRWNILREVPIFAHEPLPAEVAVNGVVASLHKLGADPELIAGRFGRDAGFRLSGTDARA
ncbi:hypothetical protein [Mycolicibacterium sp. PDY-3]|uniref:hypothetical protein n=1 Tax=Mycolicibacterium sp. PDY-3 TaxID=3376069 RepID=UPI00379DF9AD